MSLTATRSNDLYSARRVALHSKVSDKRFECALRSASLACLQPSSFPISGQVLPSFLRLSIIVHSSALNSLGFLRLDDDDFDFLVGDPLSSAAPRFFGDVGVLGDLGQIYSSEPESESMMLVSVEGMTDKMDYTADEL